MANWDGSVLLQCTHCTVCTQCTQCAHCTVCYYSYSQFSNVIVSEPFLEAWKESSAGIFSIWMKRIKSLCWKVISYENSKFVCQIRYYLSWKLLKTNENFKTCLSNMLIPELRGEMSWVGLFAHSPSQQQTWPILFEPLEIIVFIFLILKKIILKLKILEIIILHNKPANFALSLTE